MLPLFSSSAPLAFDRIVGLPYSQIEHDWYGESLGVPYRCLLAADPSFLYFAVHAPSRLAAEDRFEARFEEGLWQKEVFELFISRRGEESYRELHVSSSGAWWLAEFEGYRRRSSRDCSGAQVETYRELRESSSLLALRVPLGSLFSDACLNGSEVVLAAAILDEKPQRLISSAVIPREQADFHREELRREPLIIPSFLV